MFVSVDSTSFAGKAQPLTYAELMALEEPAQAEGEERDGIVLPDAFKKLTVRFVADDNVIYSQTFDYGATVEETDFPQVPDKEGYFGRWDHEELKNLKFDTVVTAEYTKYNTALPSYEKRENGHPVFFVSGEFSPDDSFEAVSEEPETMSELSINLWQRLQNCFSLYERRPRRGRCLLHEAFSRRRL